MHLLHVIESVSAYHVSIFPIGLEDGGAFQVNTIRSGNAKVAGDIFQAVAWQIAHHKIVAAHGIQRIDQFSAGYAIADAAAGLRSDPECLLARLQAVWHPVAPK